MAKLFDWLKFSKLFDWTEFFRRIRQHGAGHWMQSWDWDWSVDLGVMILKYMIGGMMDVLRAF